MSEQAEQREPLRLTEAMQEAAMAWLKDQASEQARHIEAMLELSDGETGSIALDIAALTAERDASAEREAVLRQTLNELRAEFVIAARQRDAARAEEREACAKVCEEFKVLDIVGFADSNGRGSHAYNAALLTRRMCAEAIRARKDEA